MGTGSCELKGGHMLKSLIRTAICGAAVGLSLFAGSALAQEKKPIRIGSFMSLTGPASFLGEDARKAMETQIEAWNKAGGLEGRPIEWIHYDDAGAAAQARTFANRLINDGVDILIGGSTTGTTMAAVPLIEQKGVPFISLASGIQIVNPIKPYVFKTVASDDLIARRILEDIRSRGLNKVALVTQTSGYGQSGREQLMIVAKELGVEIVADETFSDTDTNLTVQVTRVRNNPKVEAVVGVGTGQVPAILVRNYHELDVKFPLYLAPGVASKAFLEIIGAAGIGVRIPAAPLLAGDQIPTDNPAKRAIDDLTKLYQEKWGQTPSSFAGCGYDALHLFADALKRAGSTDPKALRDALETTKNFNGVSGTVNMSPTDHTGTDYRSLVLWEIQDGNWKLIN